MRFRGSWQESVTGKTIKVMDWCNMRILGVLSLRSRAWVAHTLLVTTASESYVLLRSLESVTIDSINLSSSSRILSTENLSSPLANPIPMPKGLFHRQQTLVTSQRIIFTMSRLRATIQEPITTANEPSATSRDPAPSSASQTYRRETRPHRHQTQTHRRKINLYRQQTHVLSRVSPLNSL